MLAILKNQVHAYVDFTSLPLYARTCMLYLLTVHINANLWDNVQESAFRALPFHKLFVPLPHDATEWFAGHLHAPVQWETVPHMADTLHCIYILYKGNWYTVRDTLLIIPRCHGSGLVIGRVYLWYMCDYLTGSQIYARKVNWPPNRHGQWGIK